MIARSFRSGRTLRGYDAADGLGNEFFKFATFDLGQRVDAEHVSKYSYPRQQRSNHRRSGIGLLANLFRKRTDDVVASELSQHAGCFRA